MVEVTRADREAAAGYLYQPYTNNHRAMRGGVLDNHPLVQAFARHRIAADKAGYERGLREAAGIAECEQVDADDTQDESDFAYNRACIDIQAAILAKLETVDER